MARGRALASDDIEAVRDRATNEAMREAAAFEICAEAGELARDGAFSAEDKRGYELAIRCALAADSTMTKTYLGYLDLAILAGEIVCAHQRTQARV